MEQNEEPGSFRPDAHGRSALKAGTSAISASRIRWRLPAVATTMALVAALCLHSGAVAQAKQTPKATGVSVAVAHDKVVQAAMPMLPEDNTVTSGSGSGSSGAGGVHGAFNLYDGVGGGIEFWFDPTTGELTVAIGAGVGEGGGGVLGTYAAGSAPEPGAYVYANADLGAGSVATVNVSGTYSLTNGVFVGSVNTTVDGRTLTIASDGGSTFDVNVVADESATGFTGAIGVNYTFRFNVADVLAFIWHAIVDAIISDYFLEDDDDTGTSTDEYSDDDIDGTTTDDATTTTDDDGYDDSSSSDSDGDGGGGGGGDDDDGACSAYSAYLPDVATAPSASSHAHAAVIVPAEEAPGDDTTGDDDSCD